jgi:hypothetical protein
VELRAAQPMVWLALCCLCFAFCLVWRGILVSELYSEKRNGEWAMEKETKRSGRMEGYKNQRSPGDGK